MAHRSRGRERPTRAARKARGDRNGILLIVGVMASLILFGVFFAKQKQQYRALDAVTLCPKVPLGTDSVTTVLVDVTDALTTAQKMDFRNQLEKLRVSIQRYGRLEMFIVNPVQESLLKPLATLCNPGRGKDIDPLVGNPTIVEKTWRIGFQEPLDQAFSQILTTHEAKTSPILESIQSVALTSFQQVDQAGRPHKLVIVSDLLQFTHEISFYGSLPKPETLIKSPAFNKVRTDLRGVEVELWMLYRQDHPQPRDLILLWETLLKEQGARLIRVYNVSG